MIENTTSLSSMSVPIFSVISKRGIIYREYCWGYDAHYKIEHAKFHILIITFPASLSKPEIDK